MERSNKLKQRFVSDHNLPISIFEEPYFTYQLQTYQPYNQAYDLWIELNDMIKSEYDDREEYFLNDYAKCRDHMITDIEKNPKYAEFNKCDMNYYSIKDKKYNEIPKTSVYIEPNDGLYFISIDIKEANFRGLHEFSPEIVRNNNEYSGLITEYLGFQHPLTKYFIRSKYSRQVIFGKLNMSRNITIQNYIMFQTWMKVEGYIEANKIDFLKVYCRNNDELIYVIQTANIKKVLDVITDLVFLLNTHDYQTFRVEFFELKKHKFQHPTGSHLTIYEKKNRPNKLGQIKMCSVTYFPQVFKLLNGFEIDENDLYFYYENNIAKFVERIKKIK
jgi:hypothetical protein